MVNSEIWKPIVGYEGLYEVSNKGRVRSLPRITHYDAGYEKRNNGKILTPSKASNAAWEMLERRIARHEQQ